MLKNFLLRKMLERQLKGVPKEQQEKIIKMIENNPELFQKIAVEAQAKIKGGMSEQAAMMEVMQNHQDDLKKAMGM